MTRCFVQSLHVIPQLPRVIVPSLRVIAPSLRVIVPSLCAVVPSLRAVVPSLRNAVHPDILGRWDDSAVVWWGPYPAPFGLQVGVTVQPWTNPFHKLASSKGTIKNSAIYEVMPCSITIYIVIRKRHDLTFFWQPHSLLINCCCFFAPGVDCVSSLAGRTLG